MDRIVCRGFWLRQGLVVKIMSAELKAAGLYKQKGVVKRVVNEQVSRFACPIILKLAIPAEVQQVSSACTQTALPARTETAMSSMAVWAHIPMLRW